jgi:formylglycine-generating enzyme required for sulfatase activity
MIEEQSNTELLNATPMTGESFRDCPDCPEMVTLPAGYSVPAFAMGKYEVTQGQWRPIMGNNPSYFSNCGDDCPVEHVSWNDAQDFIRRLNSKTGKQYRLPSEAEWEYACRAGRQQPYCGSYDPDSVAWYDKNSGLQTHPVGQKQANNYGLYDMSGNVFEWVEDCDNGDCSRSAVVGGSWFTGRYGLHLRLGTRFILGHGLRDRSLGFRVARTLP